MDTVLVQEDFDRQKEMATEVRFDIAAAIFHLRQVEKIVDVGYIHDDNDKKEMRKHLEYAAERIALIGGNLSS